MVIWVKIASEWNESYLNNNMTHLIIMINIDHRTLLSLVWAVGIAVAVLVNQRALLRHRALQPIPFDCKTTSVQNARLWRKFLTFPMPILIVAKGREQDSKCKQVQYDVESE